MSSSSAPNRSSIVDHSLSLFDSPPQSIVPSSSSSSSLYPSAYGLYGIGDGMAAAGTGVLHGRVLERSTAAPSTTTRKTETEGSSIVDDPSYGRSISASTFNSSSLPQQAALPPLNLPPFSNVWNSKSARDQLQRFEPPSSYPAIPSSTHEWYRNVMKQPSDPANVKPLFPFEGNAMSGLIPAQDSSREQGTGGGVRGARAESTSGAGGRDTEDSRPAQTGFVNAWDSLPNIDRIARAFARRTATAKTLVSSASINQGGSTGSKRSTKSTVASDLNGRTSSLKEPRSYERRSDASSRDGDDEDDEDESSSSGDDRLPILLRSRAASLTSSGVRTPPRRSPSSRDGHSRSRTRSRSSEEYGEAGQGTRDSPTRSVRTSPTISNKVLSDSSVVFPIHHHHSSHPSHHQHSRSPSFTLPSSSAPSHPIKSALRLNTTATALDSSATLAAQAIKNRIATTPGIDGAPIIRAARRFTPETDIGLVKNATLQTLNRFMHMGEMQG